MYIPDYFNEQREDEIIRIINTYPLATLVANGNEGLVANHLPFLLDITDTQQKILTGHVARNNPILDAIKNGDEVMVIYQGADAYISPNWYPSKHETHKQVPTWNYQAVHLHGNIAFIDDAKFIRGVVGRLTKLHEERIGEAQPWKMGDAPADFMHQMLSAVVGIKINITRVEAKSKLSQNKDKRDFDNVALELDKTELDKTESGRKSCGLAEAMHALNKHE